MEIGVGARVLRFRVLLGPFEGPNLHRFEEETSSLTCRENPQKSKRDNRQRLKMASMYRHYRSTGCISYRRLSSCLLHFTYTGISRLSVSSLCRRQPRDEKALVFNRLHIHRREVVWLILHMQ